MVALLFSFTSRFLELVIIKRAIVSLLSHFFISSSRLELSFRLRKRLCARLVYLSVVLQRVLSDGLQRPICKTLHHNRVVPAPLVSVSVLREQKLPPDVFGTGTRAGEGQRPMAVVHEAAEVLHGVPGVFPGLAGGDAVRWKRPPRRATPPEAQSPREGPAELAAVTRVDDGVHAAVEVTEPEDELEDGFWRTQVSVEGRWKRRTRSVFTFI